MKAKNPLLQFLPYIKNSKKEYVLGTIFSVLNVALGVFGVYVLSKVFDGIEGSITRQIFLKSLTIALGYGLILLCSGISNYIRNIYLVKGANEIYVRNIEGVYMKLSYKKLFKLLIDKEISGIELMNNASISRSSYYKIKNGDNITTEVLLRICRYLDCDISDIVECIHEEESKLDCEKI